MSDQPPYYPDPYYGSSGSQPPTCQAPITTCSVINLAPPPHVQYAGWPVHPPHETSAHHTFHTPPHMIPVIPVSVPPGWGQHPPHIHHHLPHQYPQHSAHQLPAALPSPTGPSTSRGIAPSQVEGITAVKSAARNRREKENAEFERLGRMLPLPSAITGQLDKASVIRLTASHLHLKTLFPAGISQRLGPSRGGPVRELHEMASHLMQTLDGFVFVISSYGRIMYISETASVHVGMSQVELTGNSIYEYLHPNDVSEMIRTLRVDNAELRSKTPINGEIELERQFFVRIRCVLAKRNAGLTDQGYKVIHCSGFIKLRCHEDGTYDNQGLMAIGHTLPPTAITEMRLTSSMFMFRADMTLKLVFLDTGNKLFNHDLCDLVDRSWYELIDVNDTDVVKRAHETVVKRHQSTSELYRFITNSATMSHCWLQSHFALIQLHRSSRPNCILAINHIISESNSEELPNFAADEPSTSGTLPSSHLLEFDPINPLTVDTVHRPTDLLSTAQTSAIRPNPDAVVTTTASDLLTYLH